MQSIAPLSNSDLLESVTQPLLKFEVYYEAAWQDVASLTDIGGDVLESLSLSIGAISVSPNPIAATWSAILFNKDALFFPAHPTSDLTDVFIMGRLIRLSIGIKVNEVDYYWIQLIGVMSKPRFEGKLLKVNIAGYDYAQILRDTKIRHPNNFWGSSHSYTLVAATYLYVMPIGTTGVYYQIYDGDGSESYNGEDWQFNLAGRQIVWNPDLIIINGVNTHTAYIYTAQIPEEIIADLLVLANLYVNQAAALVAMDYTETEITIDKVWFTPGISILEAIKMICERVNYRFHFEFDGTPFFKPKPSAKASGAEDLSLLQNQIANLVQDEEDSEVKNRVTIEGDAKYVPVWIDRIVALDANPNRFRGISTDATSIDAIGEKTLPIVNHLFQDQTIINNMCDVLLAEFKDPKQYITFDLEFSPFPLELYDTVRIQRRLTSSSESGSKYGTFKYGDGTKYGDNGIVIAQRGLVRDIKINRFSSTIKLEEVT